MLYKPIPVTFGRDDDGRITRSKCGANKTTQLIKKECIFAVELHRVRLMTKVPGCERDVWCVVSVCNKSGAHLSVLGIDFVATF
jgi:hypothetical protein